MSRKIGQYLLCTVLSLVLLSSGVLSVQAAHTAVLDFDGDGRTDFAVLRLSNNTWFINRSSDNTIFGIPFGLPTDILTPRDYDGDKKTDIAVFRPSTGTFFVLRSSDNRVQGFQFGQQGDEPVTGDYDGDGRADFAVVRRTNGQMIWYVNRSSNNTLFGVQFGLAGDTPAPGDYDGDGRYDFAVQRSLPSQPCVQGQTEPCVSGEPGVFFIHQSRDGFKAVQVGFGSDRIVPGDYDGDGKFDVAVLRKGTEKYFWFIVRSSDNSLLSVPFGAQPQISAEGDYDGDGRTDIATYDPTSGTFFVATDLQGGFRAFKFGTSGDYPIANFQTR